MALPPGTRIGSYEVTSSLGAGGMGEVYRARDAKLKRDVALKVLPPEFAADRDRLTRFEREAELLASLNHPNIAQIYGLEESALVMELVEGDDLAQRIARGPLPVEEAVGIARQVAEAVETAHEQGIIHRDLKPANIKVRHDGTVKVLDFGLAKALAPDASKTAAGVTNSPTLTARATQIGMIIGTAAYMAPEQAKGKPVDKRADVWAFGVVLYEMLSGRLAFDAEDVSSTLAAVLMKEPAWEALPASTTPPLRRLIERCLERDPKLRLRDIGEARILLSDPRLLRVDGERAPTRARVSSRSIAWAVAAVSVTAAIALALSGRRVETPAQTAYLTVAPPANVRLTTNGSDLHGGAISPDGLNVVFSGVDNTGKVALYLRRLDALDAAPIPGSEGGLYPFWAPNSRTVAFYAHGKLRRVDIDGTALQDICDAPTGGWGGAWNAGDVIVAGISDPGPLSRVSARGGQPVPATKLQPQEEDHDSPQFLPDGRHFIYTTWGNQADVGIGALFVASLDSSEQILLLKDLVDPGAYSHPGMLLFTKNGTLMAQRFDAERLQLTGDPQAITPRVRGPIVTSTTGAAAFLSRSLVSVLRPTWVTRDGGVERVAMPPGFYANFAIAPDGSRVAYAKREAATSTFDLWVRDLARGTERRLTFDPADDVAPVWSPNGDEIVFTSTRQGKPALYRKNANGAGDDMPLPVQTTASQLFAYAWSAASNVITYYGGSPSWDVAAFSLTDGTSRTLVNSGVNEGRGSVSPDGRWLAYDSRETSRFEVYVTTYPPSAGKWMVTTEGGAEPRWSKDGKDLLYINSITGALMTVDVSLGTTPSFGTHRQIHPGPIEWGWVSSRSYDIDAKTGRFLISLSDNPGQLTVLLNWRALLKQ